MLYIIYNFLIILLLLVYIPKILMKIIKGNYSKEIKERFGIYPIKKIKKLEGQGPVIWVHAVSVGETMAASSLVNKLKKEKPESKIVFSTVTETGQGMAKKNIKEADTIIYFPLDLSGVVKRALQTIDPDLVIIMETELWPNFLRTANNIGSKIMFANGRISDKSAKYYKIIKPLLKDALSRVEVFSMQSKQDAERIKELGVDEKKVFNTGNTKFDQDYEQMNEKLRLSFQEEFKIDKSQIVLIAGSTHDDEEKKLLDIYQQLKKKYNNLVMILAPRHIDRVEKIENYYREKGINVVRRTGIEDRNPGQEDVIILDTIGELAQMYSLADLVFIGGSLMGKGGHNILEPAAHGKMVFFGPDMFNFRDSKELLLKNNVAEQVENKEELRQRIDYYLSHRNILFEKGEKASRVIEENRGATHKNIKMAIKLLKDN